MSQHVHVGEWCAKCVEHGVVEQVRREQASEEKLRIVRGWLDNPEWPMFGPGIGRGLMDAGRMAARAAAQQILDVMESPR